MGEASGGKFALKEVFSGCQWKPRSGAVSSLSLSLEGIEQRQGNDRAGIGAAGGQLADA